MQEIMERSERESYKSVKRSGRSQSITKEHPTSDDKPEILKNNISGQYLNQSLSDILQKGEDCTPENDDDSLLHTREVPKEVKFDHIIHSQQPDPSSIRPLNQTFSFQKPKLSPSKPLEMSRTLRVSVSKDTFGRNGSLSPSGLAEDLSTINELRDSVTSKLGKDTYIAMINSHSTYF